MKATLKTSVTNGPAMPPINHRNRQALRAARAEASDNEPFDASRQAAGWKWALSATLICLGALYELLPDSIYISISLVLFIAALGVVGILIALKFPRYLTMYDAFTIFWAFTYGIGTLNSFLGAVSFERELLNSGFLSPPLFRSALNLITFSLGALLAASALHRSYLYDARALPEREAATAATLVAAFTLAAIVALASGRLGYQGDVAVAAGSSQISIFGSLISLGLGPGAALAIFLTPQSAARRRKLLWGCAIVLMLCLFTQGRRQFLYSLVLCVFAFTAGGGRILLLRWKTLLAVLVMGLSFQVVSIGYIALRMASYDALPNDGIGRLLVEGAKNVVNYDRIGLIENTLENQRDRTFIVGYLAELLGKVDTHPVAKGELLLDSFLISIPRLLYPNKGKLDFQADEVLIHPLLGLPIYDGSNTLLSGGVSDFGFIGGVAYTVAFAALFAWFARACRYFGGTAYMVVVFLLLLKVLNVEEGIAGYFSAIRAAILLAGFVWLAMHLIDAAIAWRTRLEFPRRRRRWTDVVLFRPGRRRL